MKCCKAGTVFKAGNVSKRAQNWRSATISVQLQGLFKDIYISSSLYFMKYFVFVCFSLTYLSRAGAIEPSDQLVSHKVSTFTHVAAFISQPSVECVVTYHVVIGHD